MRRVLAAFTLAAASPLAAMAGVAECKSRVDARNGGLARPYQRALRKHQSSAEGKQLVDAALAELYTQLSAEAGGWKQQARGFAASLDGVAKAMRNLIVGLTPDGSIASIEEGAKKVRGAQGRFDDLLKPSPEAAKGAASGARKDKVPKAGDAIAAATEELGKSLAAELVAKSLAPVAKNLKGLHVLRGQAKKLAELDEASAELAALKAAIQLRVTEVEYELRSHDKRLDAELRTLQALNPGLQAIAQSVQARCDAKLCAGIESDGIKEQVDAEQQATRLTRQAADLRAKGSPGLTRIDDGLQKLVDEQKSLELDSAGREAALR